MNAAKSVYIGETAGRYIHERINEQDRDIRLSQTQTSAVSEHANKVGHYPLWDEVKFIDRDPHWYSRRVKEALHIRLHPNNINRDSGIEIPERGCLHGRQHNSAPITTTADHFPPLTIPIMALYGNPPTMSEVRHTSIANNHGGTNSPTQ